MTFCRNCIYRKKSRSKYYKFYCKKTGAMIIDNVMCWGCSEGIDKTGDKQ